MQLNRNRVAVFFLAAAIIIPAFAQSRPDAFKSKCLFCPSADWLGPAPAGKAMKSASFKDPAVVSTRTRR